MHPWQSEGDRLAGRDGPSLVDSCKEIHRWTVTLDYL